MQPEQTDTTIWQDRWVELGGQGLQLHGAEAGPQHGPLVLLLHGFPAFWYSWRYQLAPLAAAGFHVVAPDLRGYNLSDKPRGVDAYRVELLTADVAELIRALGTERATMVGHDWGGLVAWFFAMRYPELLERLVILNAPHPARFLTGFTPGQLLRSTYALFFQLPRLPEWTIQAGDFALLRRALRVVPTREGAFTPEDIDWYVRALREPYALTAGLNYYRALARRWPLPWRMPRDLRPVPAETLVIWGQRDPFLRPELAEPDPRWVPHARVARLPDAGHFVHSDRPNEVNRLLRGFLQPERAAPAR